VTCTLLDSASALLAHHFGQTASNGASAPCPANDGADADFRQLRHQTKNALQHMLSVMAQHPGLRDTEAGRALAAELRRRVALAAAVSDALFGFTRAPAPFAERLGSLCESVAALLRGPDQDIRVVVVLDGPCPPALQETVLRVAHEFVGNAVKHGMHTRLAGRIEVRLEGDEEGRVRLAVVDDGWGCAGQPPAGEGLSLARLLAAREGGTVALGRSGGRTAATLDLPGRGDDAVATD
jgi:two-component sensor histidine kinase